MLLESVKKVMEDRGMTISALSRECGVHRTNLSNWLSGKQTITIETAERIMLALGLSIRKG